MAMPMPDPTLSLPSSCSSSSLTSIKCLELLFLDEPSPPPATADVVASGGGWWDLLRWLDDARRCLDDRLLAWWRSPLSRYLSSTPFRQSHQPSRTSAVPPRIPPTAPPMVPPIPLEYFGGLLSPSEADGPWGRAAWSMQMLKGQEVQFRGVWTQVWEDEQEHGAGAESQGTQAMSTERYRPRREGEKEAKRREAGRRQGT